MRGLALILAAAVAVMSSAVAGAGAVTGIAGVVACRLEAAVASRGAQGTEGVVAMPDGSVLVCEFNANRIVHIDAAGRFSACLEDANRAIGLGYDARGRLIAAGSIAP